MSTNRTFTAFLLGGVIGAGLALLYAPQAGHETRRRIREGAEDAQEWAKDTLKDAREKVTENAGKVRQMVSDKKEDVKAAIQAGKDAYYKEKERLKEAL